MRSAICLLLVALTASCAGTRDHDGAAPDSGPTNGAARDDASGDDDGEAAWKLQMAEREFEIATLEAEARLARAERDVTEAEQRVARAERDMASFEEESAIRLAREELQLDQSQESVEQRKLELEELVAMYEADEFATTTKELVIQRGRMRLEFSKRGHDLSQRSHAHMLEHELTAERTKHEQNLAKARFDHEMAMHDLEVTRMEIELSMRKKERELNEQREKVNGGGDA